MTLNKKELTLGHAYYYRDSIKILEPYDFISFLVNPERYSGIPLTAEILTENLEVPEDLHIIAYEVTLETVDNTVWIRIGSYSKQVKYVHTLQDLWYGLTGESLEFKTKEG